MNRICVGLIVTALIVVILLSSALTNTRGASPALRSPLDSLDDNNGGEQQGAASSSASVKIDTITLIDASSGTDIGILSDGDAIDLAIAGLSLSLRADISQQEENVFVSSVHFDTVVDNEEPAPYAIDDERPYALGGNRLDDDSYIAVPILSRLGMHTVSATPYYYYQHDSSNSNSNSNNSYDIKKGETMTISFMIIDRSISSDDRTHSDVVVVWDTSSSSAASSSSSARHHGSATETISTRTQDEGDGDDEEGTSEQEAAQAQAIIKTDFLQIVQQSDEDDTKIITDLILFDVSSGRDIASLSDGAVIDLSTLPPTTSLTVLGIRADIIDDTDTTDVVVESVFFDFGEVYLDTDAPYIMTSKRLTLNGQHSIEVRALPRNNFFGNGRELDKISITFTITGSAVDPCSIDIPDDVSSRTSSNTDVEPYTASTSGKINGELRIWHKITIGYIGPQTCERAEPNPFTYYRLDVAFSHFDSSTIYIVPGYYATDGNAANTGATSGNVWLVHFTPDQIGAWTWTVSFTQGTKVIENADGISAGYFDGSTGSFDILETDKSGRDHRYKGRLSYVNEHHLQFAGTKEWFLKAGADSPENFLSYDDFDNTPSYKYRKTWKLHQQDYNTGNPTWAGGRGTEIIGAINYLSEQGMNVFSFLPRSEGGDDKNVFPFVSAALGDDQLRIDVSKTSQWEVVFEHADHMGMYLHFKTQEQENDQRQDGGLLGPARILYYRELIARFGHHLALNWNIGEENTNTLDEQKAFAQYFHDTDPYGHIVVIHTGGHVYKDLVGLDTYDGASVPADKEDVFRLTLEWVTKSANAGRKWIVACDEQASATDGVVPDADDPEHDVVRKNVLWGNIMAGGAGVEYYFGYAYPCDDLNCEDFRTRANMWEQSRYALQFFSMYDVPFWTMSNNNDLISNDNWCLVDPTYEVVVVYLRNGGTATIDLPSPSGTTFTVKWYDPRNGGDLQNGSLTSIISGADVALGDAPSSSDRDWVVLLRADHDAGSSRGVVVTSSPTESPTSYPVANPMTALDLPPPIHVIFPTSKPTSTPLRSDDQTVTDLVLVDTATGEDIASITDGYVVDVSSVGTELTIRADTIGPTESVVFDLDGNTSYRVENEAPYFLGGDWDGINSVNEIAEPGDHIVSATAYSSNQGMGTPGNTLSISFTTINSTAVTGLLSIVGFILVDATTNKDIAIIRHDDEIDLRDVNIALNIQAVVLGMPGSVIFDFDGSAGFSTENISPFSLGGDIRWDYNAVDELTILGEHNITATPYSASNGDGIQGSGLTISFTIVDSDIMAVSGFMLVNADTDQDPFLLDDNDDDEIILDLDVVGDALNILALTTGTIGSVVFELNGEADYSTENASPYALGGNLGDDYMIVDELSTPGTYIVKATPYSDKQGAGIQGASHTIRITVVRSIEP